MRRGGKAARTLDGEREPRTAPAPVVTYRQAADVTPEQVAAVRAGIAEILRAIRARRTREAREKENR